MRPQIDQMNTPLDLLNDVLQEVGFNAKDVAHTKILISNLENVIFEKYEFIIDSKLDLFSNEYYEAKEVLDISSKEQSYYGYFLKKSLPLRLKEIIILTENAIPNLITPAAFSILNVEGGSKAQELGIVFLKPGGESIKSLVSKGRLFSHKFCIEVLIPALVGVINKLHKLGIAHGNINPNNIFIDEANNVMLGECVSLPCGVLQPIFYDTADRGQCTKFGKSDVDLNADYYALGMTLFSIVSKQFFDNADSLSIVSRKLNEGTFNILNELYLVNGELGDIIRALVIDDKKLRWGAKELVTINNINTEQVANLFDKSFSSRAIVFKEKEYFSKAALAHDLSIYWEEAKVFVKTETLNKWLDISSREQQLIRALEKLKDAINKRGAMQSLFAKDEEYLIKVIMLLDPEGPFRYRGFAFHINAIGTLLCASIATANNELTQIIANSLFSAIFSYYRQVSELFGEPIYRNVLLKIEKCHDNIRRAGYGYGIERCLYDLNPSLPCQSHIVANIICFDLEKLLNFMESNKVTLDEIFSKKNLLCYIASKIELQGDIVIENLKSFPHLKKSKEFTCLALLATAQNYAKIPALNHLCSIYAVKIKSLLKDHIKSTSIKNQLFSNIDRVAQSGNLNALLLTASNTNYLVQDFEGLEKAITRSRQIVRNLTDLSDTFKIDLQSKKKGLKIATNLGYIVSCCSVILAIAHNL